MFRKEKPAPKREFAVQRTFPDGNIIEFEAINDILVEITNSHFGSISPAPDGYCLVVSSLFDFEEVLAYLQSFS